MTVTAPVSSSVELLRLERVSKWFGSTRAVSEVELAVRSGEIVGLVGQNGSGKSTLVKMVTGVHRCDAGAIQVADEESFERAFLASSGAPVARSGRDEGDGTQRGSVPDPINVVQQDLALAPGLSVMENIRLKQLGGRALQPIRWQFEASQAEAALTLVPNGNRVRVTQRVREVTESDRALVALARALWPVRLREELGRSSLLLLDETTSRLTSNDVDTLFAAVRAFIARGSGALVVSHKLDEVLSYCDRVIALRNGSLVWEGHSSETDVPSLIQVMTGSATRLSGGRRTEVVFPAEPERERAAAPAPRPGHAPGAFLEVRELTSDQLQDLNFSVAAGEIVGVAGLPGSGVSTLGRVMFGDLARHRGSIHIDGKPVPATLRGSLTSGVALLPEDRLKAGLNLKASVAENISFSCLHKVVRRGRIARRRETELVTEAIERYRVVPSDPDRPVGQLSGGNQQKVLLARVVESGARVLLIEGLSRGVDVASREALYEQVREVVQAGRDVCALVLGWSEFDDIAALADRVLIVKGGRIAEEVPKERLTRDEVEAAIYRS